MSHALAAAVEELQKQLAEQLEAAAETKKMINSLRKRMDLEPLYKDVMVESAVGGTLAIKSDQFYGKPLATAVQEFLELRKRATGQQACSIQDILKGLEQGSFDFGTWKQDDRLRSLAVSLAKNTKAFHRLPNRMFGLTEWIQRH